MPTLHRQVPFATACLKIGSQRDKWALDRGGFLDAQVVLHGLSMPVQDQETCESMEQAQISNMNSQPARRRVLVLRLQDAGTFLLFFASVCFLQFGWLKRDVVSDEHIVLSTLSQIRQIYILYLYIHQIKTCWSREVGTACIVQSRRGFAVIFAIALII